MPSVGMMLRPVGGGASLDPATTAWVNAVVADGGTVSPTQQGYVDTLIKGLKTDGLFSIGDVLWLYGSENTHQAKIDIINLKTWLNNQTTPMVFTANQGYAGDGVAAFGDTGLNASTTTNFTQNSSSFMLYIPSTSGRTAGANVNPFGINDVITTHDTRLYPYAASTDVAAVITGSNGNSEFASVSGPKSAVVGSRTGPLVANAAGYRNGSSTAFSSGQSSASGSPPNGDFYIGALNSVNGAGATLFSSDQIAALWIGAGLTGSQAANLMNRVNTYMTSLGINVY